MDDNDDGSYTEVASGVTLTSYTKTGLNEGQSYKFRLRSRNTIGFSTYSSPIFTIKAATNPDVPTSIQRNEGSTTKTQVAFTWLVPTDDGGDSVIDYTIEMDTSNSGSFTEIASGVTSTSYTKTGLNEGTSYQFKVKARNSFGYSSYSSAFTIIAAIMPDEPTNFVRDEGLTSKTQVAFTWSAPSDDGGSAVIDYAIEMDDNNDGSYTEIASSVSSTSYTKTGLNEG